MAVDQDTLNKLVKLEALKDLAERVKSNDDALDAKIDDVSDEVSTLSSKIDDFESEIADTYATQDELEQVKDDYLTKEDAGGTYATKTDVASKIGSAYKVGGSKTSIEELGTPNAENLGYVYNMTAEFTLTSDNNSNFIEQTGTFPAGTNVAVAETTGGSESPVYKFDILSGFVDLSDYAETTEVEEMIDDELKKYYDKTTIDGMIASKETVSSMLDEIFESDNE